jgi:hypothetical protein
MTRSAEFVGVLGDGQRATDRLAWRENAVVEAKGKILGDLSANRIAIFGGSTAAPTSGCAVTIALSPRLG